LEVFGCLLLLTSACAGTVPRLSISDVTVSEVSCGSQVATFTVSVNAPFGKNASVQFATADGSAIAGIDYTAVSGTLNFPRGSKPSQTITVPITDVLIPGPNKTFYLNLSNAVNATLSKSQGAGTIQAPSIAKCQSCGLSCDDGDVCTQDTCSTTLGCKHVNVSATATPWCQLLAAGGQTFATCNASGEWVDSDGDGLSDAAETQGYIDVNGNGVYDAGIDVPLPGADPHKPDVYLHYDYTYASDHDHNPPAQAIQYILDAFAANGVNLHIDPVHNAIDETTAKVVTVANPTTAACTGPSAINMAQLRQTYLSPNLGLAYHYMVFGHYATCDPSVDPNTGQPYCSACPNDPENPACGAIASQKPQPDNLGTAEVYGDDAIVATQAFTDAGLLPIPLESWAGLAMHEFGHNLGLEHGGADCFNFKPNYVSLMNYNFYTNGIPVGASPGDSVAQSCTTDADCYTGDHPSATQHCSTATNTCFRIDYSDRLFNTLDEPGVTTGVNEELGLQGGANDTDISWTKAAGQRVQVPTNGSPIDFNGNGEAIDTSLIYDVNGDFQKTLLTSQNDWAHLQFSYQCQPTFANDQAASGSNFERMFQHYVLLASRAQPAGSWMSNTIVQVVGVSGQSRARNKPAVDWFKERLLWPK
jgi:hypothetical protein